MTHPTVVDSASISPRVEPDPGAPLVSVLIRSIDRSHLQAALDSIALQTYPNIEVVVIAARPGHRPLDARCGAFDLRLVPTDTVLPRSRAANRALDEARGQWLLFLDDDDWVMPSHVARLADVLGRQPHALAAYTGVSLADDVGVPLGQAMDLPFDAVRQLAGNLTPIHAVMFSRELLALGVRFDETLDRYEDWDFWVQVSRHTVLVHLPGVSAVYRIHQSSGVHEDAGSQGLGSRRIYAKWQAHLDGSEIEGLMARGWAAFDLQLALARADDRVRMLEQGLVEAQQSIQQLSAALQAASERNRALTDSTSWRITRPLRWLSGKLRSRA